MPRTVFNEEHEAFRQVVRDFLAKEAVPHLQDWVAAKAVSRDFYRKLGELGILGIEVPEEYGGGAETGHHFGAVFAEEVARAGATVGTAMTHANIILPYLLHFGTEEQKRRWVPGCVSGDIMLSIAMTEPGTGSDLAGIQTKAVLSEDGTHYVLNGAKTFITGGTQCDLVLVVCRTSPAPADNRRKGLSILVVDTTSEGYAVGRSLDKIGLHASDTAELSFTDVKVPVGNLLGEEGEGFFCLGRNLARERLVIAVQAAAAAAAAVRFAKEYTQDRTVFGKSVASFQNTKFVLAECATEVEAARLMAYEALERDARGELSADYAAMAKLLCTETASRVIDKCLQLHGGYGYMLEYPIARLYADTRVMRIYGGTSEVMKTIIAKSIGL
ncbi:MULTISPECIES: acyl-CoA dehydrogenase family protein [unclassified Streptomyces]|uniref:acyl-CoA dehydrogenase family protein n=1 Tax=unclassified Streptomyces TaxID=2593676 RepID=UPI002E342531|nr:acyl-CoA dehydrogenase family protein [Streptomyces sp. NBC_01280]WSE20312.1 acyl-CoA dehydrogenase family protein [Streptomyces sp. NBC_01397]